MSRINARWWAAASPVVAGVLALALLAGAALGSASEPLPQARREAPIDLVDWRLAAELHGLRMRQDAPAAEERRFAERGRSVCRMSALDRFGEAAAWSEAGLGRWLDFDLWYFCPELP